MIPKSGGRFSDKTTRIKNFMLLRRLVFLVTAIVLLAACAPKVAPAGTASVPVALSESLFNASTACRAPGAPLASGG